MAVAQPAPIRGFPPDALSQRTAFEHRLRAVPDTARLREYQRIMSERPHHAGSPGSKAVAEWALSKFREFGLDAKIEQLEALAPWPTSRRLELLAPEPYVAKLAEPVIREDKDSGDPGQLPTYNAYSADGDVTAELVYVNYGIPEDYEQLARLGIEVKGKIVIARYGQSWRGIKVKVAAEHGAVGCIIYSDPREDGYYVGDVYPKGPMRNETGVQRGSVMDMPLYPGDPLTPGWGAVPGSRKLPRAEAKTLMKIPVLPLSHGDALPLLRNLGGPVVPADNWKGALPITYHVGPGPAKVRLAVRFDWQVRPLYNVIARIPGSTFPDEWVIHGNHHDAWVNGADDPISGAVALLESARSFGEAVKAGWRPQRTVIFALWDGEEFGLLGSTEWMEAHADELATKAVTYFNSDTNNRGTLSAAGSHTLESFVREVARDTPDPKTGKNALEALVARDLNRAKTAADSTKARNRTFTIGALGSGSDYSAFIDHGAIASLNLQHGGESADGFYHSIYDSYDSYNRFSDTSHVYGKAEANALGVAVARLADAPILPWSFTDAARTYRQYLAEIDSLATLKLGANQLDLFALRQALDTLAAAGTAWDDALERATGLGSPWLAAQRQALAGVNRDVYLSERDLADSAGLPRRPWYRHTIYAPGFYTGYGVKTMPGIREAVEQKDPAEAQAQTKVVAEAIVRMAKRAQQAADGLDKLTRAARTT
ncbi:MAG: M28 family peptidase [Gemmatimonadetes bacterium]|nr:M28 family peptidase [Gemmatimonadota bacterium]